MNMTLLETPERTQPPMNQMEVMEKLAENHLPEVVLDLLGLIKERHENTYHHSLENFAVILRVGPLLGWTVEETKKVAAGAALHDIGKVLRPEYTEFIDSTTYLGNRPEDRAKNPTSRHDIEGGDFIRQYSLGHELAGVPLSAEDAEILEYAALIADTHHKLGDKPDEGQQLNNLVDKIGARSDSRRKYLIVNGTLQTEDEAARSVNREDNFDGKPFVFMEVDGRELARRVVCDWIAEAFEDIRGKTHSSLLDESA